MRVLTCLYLITLSYILAPSHVYASAQTDFDQGVTFFKEEKYNLAVEKFTSALNQGLKTVSLYYNLASTHFKLQQYSEAKRYFQKVAQTPEMRDLATYNLGLIALKQQQTDEARQIFTRIVRDSKDKKLVSLSATQLARIRSSQDQWRVYISANYGHDSNITVLPSETSLDIADNFYNVFLSIDSVVSGKRKNGWLVDATYLRIDFKDSDNFDEYQYSAGIKKTQPLSNWDTSIHLSLSQNNFSGNDYQSAAKLDLKGYTRLSRTQRVELRYRYEDINSELSVYDYLEGWRQRARIGYSYYSLHHIYNIYYELELNQRNDLVTSLYAYEYSPTRHTVRGRYTYIPVENWNIIAELGLRASDFPASQSFDRNDDQVNASIGIDYRIDKTLRLKTKLEHINNMSSVALYDYDKTRVMLGLSKLF